MATWAVVLIGMSMLYLAVASRIEAYVKMLAAQGFLLFLLVLASLDSLAPLSAVMLAVETLVFKTLLIPWILLRTVRRNRVYREFESTVPAFWTLFTTSLLFAAGFLVSFWAGGVAKGIRPLEFGVAISVIVTSLFLVMTRKHLVAHVLGFMALQNGIFLLSLSAVRETPFVVDLGLLLDVFLVIFLFGLFLNRIRDAYDGMLEDDLTDLQD